MKITGNTTVNEDVFVLLAQEALQKVQSVTLEQKKIGLGSFFSQRLSPVISAKKEDQAKNDETKLGSVSYELKISAIYGVSIPEMVTEIRTEIKKVVEEITGYNVSRIDVEVVKLTMPEKETDEIDPAAETNND